MSLVDYREHSLDKPSDASLFWIDPYGFSFPSSTAGEFSCRGQREIRILTFPPSKQARTVDHSAKGEEIKARHQRERELQAQQHKGDGQKLAESQQSDGQKEKQEMMEKARANTQPNAKDFERKGEREVYDPVTGQNVIVKDAKLEGELHTASLENFLFSQAEPNVVL
jgi:hypothetical protein